MRPFKYIPLLLLYFTGIHLYGQAEPNQTWMNFINSNETALSRVYLEKAILVSPEGSFVRSMDGSGPYLRKLREEIGQITDVSTIREISIGDGISYEIGQVASSGQIYKQLIIWNDRTGVKKRELELIVKASDSDPDDEGVNLARQRWMALCNAHNAYELASIMYTPNAIYYNHKPVVSGTDAIAGEYGYMNRPGYELKLTPIHVEMVDARNVFEIGQCSGTYGGKYMIWWVKSDSGEWMVMLDSNK